MTHEWIEVRRLCDAQPRYVKGRCLHIHTIAVETLGVLEDSERVAFLCLDCDAQLPADFAAPASRKAPPS